MAAEVWEDAKVRWTTVAMASLATIALEQATLEPGRPRTSALGMTIIAFIVPMIVAAVFLGHRERRVSARMFPFVMLLLVFALPFGLEGARLLRIGRSVSGEIVLLGGLRNLGLGLAAWSHRPAHARLSALVSLFLVTVASPVGGEGGSAVLIPVGGFTVAGIVWLMLVYWKGLHFPASAGLETPKYAWRGAIWILGVALLTGTVAAVGPSRAATALMGLVPTSGGTDASDPNARSGVGDGDNEVDASEHPESVGFTESEVYLETDRPTLYDSFNEQYGEPLKPKKTEKMIALGAQQVREQKERPSENLHAGREFAAIRKKPEPRAKRPGERAAKALVYVKGPTPLHMPLTTYNHFNGKTWHEEPCCQRDLPAHTEPSGTWLRITCLNADGLAGAVTHQVKIGTLESSPMPLPSHLTRFRIGSVNRTDFFAWAQFGIVRMTDRPVPAGAVIDTEARTVDPERLRTLAFAPGRERDKDHYLGFQGEYAIDPRVASLARFWGASRPEGWAQVEAVVSALRRNYLCDRTATASEECVDVVEEFLLKTHRGPDYLFATAAAVMLRSLGYPVRLVSGLYASPKSYDPLTRHTLVTSSDVHVWAEVRLPDGLWIAIEPTPGYELLPPARTWSERLARALAAVGLWGREHVVVLSMVAAMGVGLFVCRRFLADRAATLLFGLDSGGDPRRLVLRALSLVERRARWAGCPRPSELTPARWYRPLARQAAGESCIALESLVRLADWALHAPDGSGPLRDDEALRSCREAVRTWTCRRFRSAISLTSTKVVMS